MRDKDIRVHGGSVVERDPARRYRAYPPFSVLDQSVEGPSSVEMLDTEIQFVGQTRTLSILFQGSNRSLDVGKDSYVNDSAASETTAHLQLLPAGGQVDVVRGSHGKRSMMSPISFCVLALV